MVPWIWRASSGCLPATAAAQPSLSAVRCRSGSGVLRPVPAAGSSCLRLWTHGGRHQGLSVSAVATAPSPRSPKDDGTDDDELLKNPRAPDDAPKAAQAKPAIPFPDRFPDWDPTVQMPQGQTPGTEGLPFATVPEMWQHLAATVPDLPCWSDPHRKPRLKSMTFKEAFGAIGRFSAGLHCLGLRRGDIVSVFGESSHRWCIADQAIMMNGAVDAVRGSNNTPTEELEYILEQSGSVGVFVEDAKTLRCLAPKINALNAAAAARGEGKRIGFAVLLWGGKPPSGDTPGLDVDGGCALLNFNDVFAAAADAPEPMDFYASYPEPTDLATLVYTSGTTGESPQEGAVLTHANIMYQIGTLGEACAIQPGETAVTLLPPWHIYERTAMYYRESVGVFHSFTSVKRIRQDLTRIKPDYFCTVPLVLQTLCNKALQGIEQLRGPMRYLAKFFMECSRSYVRACRIANGVELDRSLGGISAAEKAAAWRWAMLLKPIHLLASAIVYKKIRDAIGVKQAFVSGGGSLAKGLDDFYEIIGLEVLNGWGLTETSPVLCMRRPVRGSGEHSRNVRGSVGYPLPATEIRIVDPDTRQDLPAGDRGLILARGPGVMRSHLGYYLNEEANKEAFIDGNEWFDTGDLGFMCPEVEGSNMAGQLVLTGRMKDTIVLSNGENIEPQPIEDACIQSPYIRQMMVVGQDQKHLGALVVPDYDAIKESTFGGKSGDKLSQQEILDLLRAEISKNNQERGYYRNDESIVKFRLLDEGFTHDNGMLSNTMKIKRFQVMAVHQGIVDAMFSDNAFNATVSGSPSQTANSDEL